MKIIRDDTPAEEQTTEEHVRQMMNKIIEQREEILVAFIAKYNCEPDRIVQVVDGNSWCVKMMDDPSEVKQQQLHAALQRVEELELKLQEHGVEF